MHIYINIFMNLNIYHMLIDDRGEKSNAMCGDPKGFKFKESRYPRCFTASICID
jgi:hypothetical protein